LPISRMRLPKESSGGRGVTVAADRTSSKEPLNELGMDKKKAGFSAPGCVERMFAHDVQAP